MPSQSESVRCSSRSRSSRSQSSQSSQEPSLPRSKSEERRAQPTPNPLNPRLLAQPEPITSRNLPSSPRALHRRIPKRKTEAAKLTEEVHKHNRRGSYLDALHSRCRSELWVRESIWNRTPLNMARLYGAEQRNERGKA